MYYNLNIMRNRNYTCNKPSQAKPSQAKPSQAKPSQAKPRFKFFSKLFLFIKVKLLCRYDYKQVSLYDTSGML